MATHDHAIVDAMRRRVVQLDRGRVVRDESRGVYETSVRSTPPPEPTPAADASSAVEPDTSSAAEASAGEVASADGTAAVAAGADAVAVGEITGEVPVVTEPGAET
jgi:cell division transport system ATP-binding protein